MKGNWTKSGFALSLLGAGAVAGGIGAAQVSRSPSNDVPEEARIAFSRPLPRLDGTHLKATVVEITYGPGESSPPHRHPCPVIGYVFKGTLRTQMEGDAVAIYKAGQSFYEPRNRVHVISANASDKEPVKFVAYFVCDCDVPLTEGPAENAMSRAKKP